MAEETAAEFVNLFGDSEPPGDTIQFKQPRVVMCVPVYTGVTGPPFIHFQAMAHHHGMAEMTGLYKTRYLVPGPKVKIQQARNWAVQQAILSGSTHIFFVDDDFCCPENTLDRLLARDVDIVGPLFFRGGGMCDPLVFRWQNGNLWTVKDWRPDTLEEFDGIGTGCVLIKTDVFRKMDWPYFYYPEVDMNQTMDVRFCIRAKEAGFRIWCDTTFDCDQMGLPERVGRKDFERKRDEERRSASAAEVLPAGRVDDQRQSQPAERDAIQAN